jgi:hypothetical protein
MKRAVSGNGLTRLLDQSKYTRGTPQTSADNDQEFCGKTMLGVGMRSPDRMRLLNLASRIRMLISNRSMGLRDECLKEHCFITLTHAQALKSLINLVINAQEQRGAL